MPRTIEVQAQRYFEHEYLAGDGAVRITGRDAAEAMLISASVLRG